MKKLPLRPLDFLVIILSLTLLTFSILLIKGNKTGTAQLIIETQDEKYIYPLSKNRNLDIPGLIGNSQIVIEGGTARFVYSPCPNKTCIHTGKISRNGEVAACLPNGIIIHIENQSDNEMDALTQ